jgi:uncharacterized membrane protein
MAALLGPADRRRRRTVAAAAGYAASRPAEAERDALRHAPGLLGGAFGSLVDSLLGATVQFSGFNAGTQRLTGRPGPGIRRISGAPLLSNSGVNLASASATAALVAWLVLRLL